MRSGAAGAIIMAVVFAAFLMIQDRRASWPFADQHAAPAPALTPTPASAELPAANARSEISLAQNQLDTLGIQLEPVRLESFSVPLRAVATVVADESRISHVHTRVAGWIEELFVNTTGQNVRAGERVAGVFSQELYSSQLEYLAALRQAQRGPDSAVIAAGRTRLKVLGMSEAEISQIEKSQQPRRLIMLTSPRTGVVLRRGVSVGTAVDPSTEIVTIADYSQVWVIAEAPEADVPQIRSGLTAKLSFPASGRAPFVATVDFVYPALSEGSRTGRVRLSVPNTDGQLRPGSYGTAEFSVAPREVLTVARDAVIYTGDAHLVFVRAASGALTPRAIKIGARIGERIEVTTGLTPDEQVVSTGVFLVDSESRLRASGNTGHSGHSSPGPRDAPPRVDANSEPASSAPAQHQNHDDLKATGHD